MAQRAIVVVDDHPLFLRGLVAVLEAGGLTVVGAARGVHEALADRGHARSPTSCVLDLLPGRTAAASTCSAGSREMHGDRPALVVLTVSRDPGDMLAAVRAGADGYLTKDQPPERLARGAERRLRRRGGDVAARWQRTCSATCGRVTHRRRRPPPAPAGPSDARGSSRSCSISRPARPPREIAERLFLSPETVRWHVKAILRKLERTHPRGGGRRPARGRAPDSTRGPEPPA